MAAADKLLGRLQRVRRCGSDAWMACCPAHEDRSPSLSIRQLEDGTLLIHCFAGCDSGAILTKLNLELRDLFPVPLTKRAPPRHRGAHVHAASAALRCHQRDALIVAVAASQIAAGNPLDDHDLKLLFAVAGRARRVAEMCCHEH